MTLVYITCRDEKEAVKISRYLLEKKLIACSNIFPVRSMYHWKGKMQNHGEFAILAKTMEKNYNKIKKEVEKMHSYDVPCILKINAEANESYDRWVREEVGQQ